MTAGWRSEARARLDAATPGPWAHGYDDDSGRVDATRGFGGDVISGDPAGATTPVVNGGQDSWAMPSGVLIEADAEFIAHAPTDLGRALDALDAVLALHAPESEYGGTVCSHCIVEVDCGYPDGEVPSPASWPCPTVKAIEGTEDA